jgi:hypothetical protein
LPPAPAVSGRLQMSDPPDRVSKQASKQFPLLFATEPRALASGFFPPPTADYLPLLSYGCGSDRLYALSAYGVRQSCWRFEVRSHASHQGNRWHGFARTKRERGSRTPKGTKISSKKILLALTPHIHFLYRVPT